MDASAVLAAAGAVIVGFLPPTLFAIHLRNAERRRPEPWRAVRAAFLWGASGAALLAILVETSVLGLQRFPFSAGFVGIVVLAPIVEEVAKAVGLPFVRDADPEPEDGFIYGGAAGLGFAATENVVYFLTALGLGGLESGVATAIYRSLATVALHASASAWTGRGIWMARRGASWLVVVPALAFAILLHAAYNALASTELVLGLVAALALALLAYRRVLRRIRTLDAA